MSAHLPSHGSKLTASIILLFHNLAHPIVASGLDGRPRNSLQKDKQTYASMTLLSKCLWWIPVAVTTP
jgi:hypothetical protein